MREEYEAWFTAKFGFPPMPIHSRVLDFCWLGYQAGQEPLRQQVAEAQAEIKRLNEPVILSEWQQFQIEIESLRQQITTLKEDKVRIAAEALSTVQHDYQKAKALRQQLAASQKQIVMLRDGIENAQQFTIGYNARLHLNNALAATDPKEKGK